MKTENEILKPIYQAEMSFDNGNFEFHKSLLLDEFTFQSPFGSFNKTEDYMNWLKAFYDNVTTQGGTRHLVMNPVITFLNDKEVKVESYLLIINKKSMLIMGTSEITDVLKLTDDGWKFSFREIKTDQQFN